MTARIVHANGSAALPATLRERAILAYQASVITISRVRLAQRAQLEVSVRRALVDWAAVTLGSVTAPGHVIYDVDAEGLCGWAGLTVDGLTFTMAFDASYWPTIRDAFLRGDAVINPSMTAACERCGHELDYGQMASLEAVGQALSRPADEVCRACQAALVLAERS